MLTDKIKEQFLVLIATNIEYHFKENYHDSRLHSSEAQSIVSVTSSSLAYRESHTKATLINRMAKMQSVEPSHGILLEI
jgi:hypothetical protein